MTNAIEQNIDSFSKNAISIKFLSAEKMEGKQTLYVRYFIQLKQERQYGEIFGSFMTPKQIDFFTKKFTTGDQSDLGGAIKNCFNYYKKGHNLPLTGE